ncbi:UNVERIFIED_CONTAM: Telomere repeat-binding factor 1 [Sesamum radiatum]|uniref:MYB transcription factor n=1 Tax=Sesamum radiatum TaxID=300843 RepID=A0AAW2RW47_SESRA
MGAPKQKWTPEEEAALKAGVLKHGPGKWRTILKDPQFSGVLYLRSNVDLKDKWRNMSVMANGWGSRERARLALKRMHPAPKHGETSMALSALSQSEDEIVDARPLAPSGGSSPNDGPKRSIMRLDNLIMEAINNLREPGGSNKTSIAAYIEDQYWAPPNFKRILSAKLKHLAATGKLIKMKRKYKIASPSTLSERRRNPSIPVEGRQRISPRIDRDDISLTKSQIDLELAKMRSMTPQEAAAAAAQAVAEAEAAMAEAEEAAREAEAAEADAEAAQAFAEAALKTLKGRNTPRMELSTETWLAPQNYFLVALTEVLLPKCTDGPCVMKFGAMTGRIEFLSDSSIVVSMDQGFTDNESLIARVEQLERERDELHKDIEQLCMQQAGPAYLGVATRMHFQRDVMLDFSQIRTAALEQEIENLKNKLSTCTRENQNLQEELSEAYRIKSQLADLHSAEVLKNVEAEKQLKFFQGCVAAAFAERDNAIMEAEKAKEKVELMPQELDKSQKRVEELTTELLQEKELVTALQIDLEKREKQNEVFKEVIEKFYHIRVCSLENFTDASWEEKCECLMNDSDEMWRFQNDEDASTSNYINSLEAEIETLRKGVDNLQSKLRVGLEIETHLKKKVSDLEKKKYRIDIINLLEEGNSELKSINDLIVEKMRQLELSRECNLKSSLIQEKELQESECRDVHDDDHDLPAPSISETVATSEALALALQEKVAALLLLSQQEERHLLERNVNAALQKKVEELQRNLLQVTNEKVKALMELAQLKQERYMLQEKISQDKIQGKQSGEIAERRTVPEKDGKLKNLLKKSYLTRWVGGSDGNDADAHHHYEKTSHHMDFARMRIENASLKESLESMEHLLSSVRRLRVTLLKVKDSAAAETENVMHIEALDQVIAEANLVKTALSSSLPLSWSAETDQLYSEINDNEKVDFVSAAGLEMVELLIFAAQILKTQISHNKARDKETLSEGQLGGSIA